MNILPVLEDFLKSSTIHGLAYIESTRNFVRFRSSCLLAVVAEWFSNFKITNKILYINGNRRFVLTISYQVSLGVRGGCWLHHRCCPDQGLIRQLGRQPDRHHHRDPAHLRRHLPQGMYWRTEGANEPYNREVSQCLEKAPARAFSLW